MFSLLNKVETVPARPAATRKAVPPEVAFTGYSAGLGNLPNCPPQAIRTDSTGSFLLLAANDPAVMPGFALRLPTLVVQGTTDVFVLEPLTAALTSRLLTAGAPVTYHTYPGKDHFTIIPAATPEGLAFLAKRLR